MSRHTLYHVEPKLVRDTLLEAVKMADEMSAIEGDLIRLLYQIDQRRFFVRFGYTSLRGFINHGLRLTRTQSQRLAAQVRRYEPTVNSEQR